MVLKSSLSIGIRQAESIISQCIPIKGLIQIKATFDLEHVECDGSVLSCIIIGISLQVLEIVPVVAIVLGRNKYDLVLLRQLFVGLNACF